MIQRLALQRRYEGYRRLTKRLRDQGLVVNAKRVLRLMRADNLLSLRRRPFVQQTTDSRHKFKIVANLARGLEPTGFDQLWVADITYVQLAEGFVYLAVVVDAFSRKVVGWALDDHLEARLAIEALDMAIAARNPPQGLIHHSDRGVQYACNEYAARLDRRGGVRFKVLRSTLSISTNRWRLSIWRRRNSATKSFWHFSRSTLIFEIDSRR